ncbi:DUF397 domain-containing protein [Streptomyces klenkii]
MTNNSALNAFDIACESSWFKSSHSGDNTGAGCISVATLTNNVAVRDSKQQNGPAFITPSAAWSSFIREVKTGRWAA